MDCTELEIPGVKLLLPDVFPDDRGFFLETYHEKRYADLGVDVNFCQDNHSVSSKDTLRGMHFQSSPGQAKLVSCSKGAIYDVVVDMRYESPSFKQWIGLELSEQNHYQLFLPVGCAHGFLVLSEVAYVNYKVSAFYDPKTEKDFAYNDPEINIHWPVTHPILSKRDLNAPSFSQALSQNYSKKEEN